MRLFLLILFASLLLTGCKKSSPIVGKWLDQINENVATRCEFKADGTCVHEWLSRGEVSSRMTSRYVLNGESLSMTQQKIFRRKQGTTTDGVDETLTIKWENNDRMTLFGKHPEDGRPMELGRYKRVESF